VEVPKKDKVGPKDIFGVKGKSGNPQGVHKELHFNQQ